MKDRDYQWVRQCIESCTNDWQLQTSYELILLFEKKYIDALEIELLILSYTEKQSVLNIL